MRHWKAIAFLALVWSATIVAPTSLEAQMGKIGVINTNQVLAESAAGAAAGDTFNAYMTEKQQPLLDLQAEINVKAQQLETQRLALSQSALAARTAELDKLQRDFTRGQEDLQTDLEAKQSEVLEPVYDLANSVIDAYAKEMGFYLIIDPTAAQGILVFMDPAADVTADIIRRMDEASATPASSTPSTPAATTPTPAAAPTQ